jgi:hypothetical protein
MRMIVSAMCAIVLTIAWTTIAAADRWLPGAPADKPIAGWVVQIEKALANPEFRGVFLNDPRSPVAPIMHLMNRAAKAQEDQNLEVARDLVRQALEVLDRGVQRGFYSRADIEPVKRSISMHVPTELHASQERASRAGLSQVGSEPSPFLAGQEERQGGTTSDQSEVTSALVRGEVLEIEGSAYIIRDLRGSEVRLPVDQDTRMEHTPKVGDEIFAQMADDGRVRSIRSASEGVPEESESNVK